MAINAQAQTSVLVAGGVVSGGVVGYFIAKKHLETKYAALALEEIENVKATYHKQMLNKEGIFSTPQQAAEVLGTYKDEVAPYSPPAEDLTEAEEVEGRAEQLASMDAAIDDPDEPPTVVINNIFVDRDIPEFEEYEDWETVLRRERREDGVPYLIPVEEFMNNESDYEQLSISWFDKDETLMDEREQIIPDVEGTVGLHNLSRFGQHSNDKHIVYVRNDRLKVDFEIAWEEGSYAAMVMGVPETMLEESGRRERSRKPRDERDG